MSDGLFPLLMTGGFSPGLRVAGYSLEEQIGRGGMAVVFRALDERLNRQVALKILAPALAADVAFRQRFIRESRAAAAVDDPNIIPVFGAGEAEGVLFIAMRLVRGGDLRTMVATQGPLEPMRAAWIVSAVASALDAAHAAGLVHRDVKPANMLLDVRPGRPDHVYLSDFGLTKGSLTSANLTNLSGSGLFMGTVDYAAPEQIQGKAVDGRTDQYALGCAAFELLCGQPPYTRDQGLATIYAHLSEPPPQLSLRQPGLSGAVDGVFAKVLAKSPYDRFATCQEFAQALRWAVGQQPYPADGRAAAPYPQGGADIPRAREAAHSGPSATPDVAGAGQPDGRLAAAGVGAAMGAAGAVASEPADPAAPTGPQKAPARRRFPARIRPGKRSPARTPAPEAATRDMVVPGDSIVDTVLPKASTADPVLPAGAAAGAAVLDAPPEAAQQIVMPQPAAPAAVAPEAAAVPGVVAPGAAVPGVAALQAMAAQAAANALAHEAAAPEVVVAQAAAGTLAPEAGAAPEVLADPAAPPAAAPWAEAGTVLPVSADADTVAPEAPAVPWAAAAVPFAPEAPVIPGGAEADTVAPAAPAVPGSAEAGTVPPEVPVFTVAPFAAPGAAMAPGGVPPGTAVPGMVAPEPDGVGQERPGRQRSPLRSRSLAISLAAGLVVIGGGVGVLLARSSNGPSPSTAASYSFAPRQYQDGLVIVRRWTLTGDPLLTETITASSATGKALVVPFDEPIPASIASPQTVRFNPAPAKILDGGRLVQWNLRVPASGSVVVGYRATVASSGAAKTQLNQLAAEFDALPVGPGIATIGPPATELRSLRISPSSVRLAVGHTVQLTLSGVLTDGKSATATTLSGVAWQTADPAVATVGSSGKVTGKKAGSTRVTAQKGPVTVSIGVTVTGSAKPSSGSSTAPGPQPTSAQPPVTTGPPPPPNTTPPQPPPTTGQPTPTVTPSPLGGANMGPTAEDAVLGPAAHADTAQRAARAHAPGSVAKFALLIVAILGFF